MLSADGQSSFSASTYTQVKILSIPKYLLHSLKGGLHTTITLGLLGYFNQTCNVTAPLLRDCREVHQSALRARLETTLRCGVVSLHRVQERPRVLNTQCDPTSTPLHQSHVNTFCTHCWIQSCQLFWISFIEKTFTQLPHFRTDKIPWFFAFSLYFFNVFFLNWKLDPF